MKGKILFLIFIIIAPAIFFWSSFTNFFFSDDFFHMVLTRQQGILEAFNIFKPAAMDFFLYRPFGTQFFWGVGNAIFGLNPAGYHVIYYLFFVANILLVWAISRSKLAAVIYAFSASNYNRLYFLSTFQEMAMATFILLALFFYTKKTWIALIMFALALTSKEIAVALPGILIVQEYFFGKKKFIKVIPFILLAAGYFLAHKYLYGFFPPSSYPDVNYVLSPISTLNNYFWYFVWTLGLPEQFVNVHFFTLPTIINPQLFYSFGPLSTLIMSLFLLLVSGLVATVLINVKKIKTIGKTVFFGITIFVGFLLPVAFFPFHKFASSLSLPLAGFALLLGIFLKNIPKTLAIFIIGTYLSLSFVTTKYNQETHWNSTRAKITSQVFIYFNQYYPNNIKSYSNIYFLGKNSTEIKWSLSDSYGLQILYNDNRINTYYEDSDNLKNLSQDSLAVDSSLFL